jgi:hypothetical protein
MLIPIICTREATVNHLNSPFKILAGVSALLITYSYNDMLVFSAELIVFVNVMFYLLMMAHIGVLAAGSEERVPILSWAIMVTVFLAGLNIRFKAKMLVFLCIAYALWTASAWLWSEKSTGKPRMARMLPLLSLVIVLAGLALLAAGHLNTGLMLGFSMGLLMLECGAFIMRARTSE